MDIVWFSVVSFKHGGLSVGTAMRFLSPRFKAYSTRRRICYGCAPSYRVLRGTAWLLCVVESWNLIKWNFVSCKLCRLYCVSCHAECHICWISRVTYWLSTTLKLTNLNVAILRAIAVWSMSSARLSFSLWTPEFETHFHSLKNIF